MFSRTIIPVALIAGLLSSALLVRGDELPPNPAKESPSSSPTTSRAASLNAMQHRVENLVREMGVRDFQRRERAWKLLKGIGDPAIPWLVPYIEHDNPEVRQRVMALFKRPKDADIRIDAAVTLMTSGDPSWIEKGVYMVFEDPITDYPKLKARHEKLTGIDHDILTPVVDQLKGWERQRVRFLERQAKHKANGKTEFAEQERKLHEGSLVYEAEAAYWQAREIMEDYHASKERAATQPASGE